MYSQHTNHHHNFQANNRPSLGSVFPAVPVETYPVVTERFVEEPRHHHQPIPVESFPMATERFVVEEPRHHHQQHPNYGIQQQSVPVDYVPVVAERFVEEPRHHRKHNNPSAPVYEKDSLY